MADLDDRRKRASSVQLLAPFVLASPLPDGTVSGLDRPHVMHLYAAPADEEFPDGVDGGLGLLLLGVS